MCLRKGNLPPIVFRYGPISCFLRKKANITCNCHLCWYFYFISLHIYDKRSRHVYNCSLTYVPGLFWPNYWFRNWSWLHSISGLWVRSSSLRQSHYSCFCCSVMPDPDLVSSSQCHPFHTSFISFVFVSFWQEEHKGPRFRWNVLCNTNCEVRTIYPYHFTCERY